MQITQKGQITIPSDIRKRFGFLPHTEVEFRIKNNHVVLEKTASSKNKVFRKQLEAIKGSSKVRMSTNALMHLLRRS